MSHTNTRIETETARCTRAIPRLRSVVESRSTGHTVNPSSTAPSPKHVNEKPVAKMRHSRFGPLDAGACRGSFKSVRSLDLDQQLAPADIRTQHQRFGFHREQLADPRDQPARNPRNCAGTP